MNKQMPYKSPIMQRDIKLPNWSNPRARDKVNILVKAELALRKNIFSTLDIVFGVIIILIIKVLINHVSISLH